LPIQPADKAYQQYQEVKLNIPVLGINIPLLGVPQVNGAWDATWLGNDAGWLTGTAFPGISGNSVIVGHVYLASGLPGPFVNLESLKWGDKIIVENGSQTLTFVVRSVAILEPDTASIMRHESSSVLTLVTCKGYNELTGHYNKRVVVKAEFVGLTTEKK
jgi:LPXTG-site transpeptidase (sortase) family protein